MRESTVATVAASRLRIHRSASGRPAAHECVQLSGFEAAFKGTLTQTLQMILLQMGHSNTRTTRPKARDGENRTGGGVRRRRREVVAEIPQSELNGVPQLVAPVPVGHHLLDVQVDVAALRAARSSCCCQITSCEGHLRPACSVKALHVFCASACLLRSWASITARVRHNG